jgi:hypothetical protein
MDLLSLGCEERRGYDSFVPPEVPLPSEESVIGGSA